MPGALRRETSQLHNTTVLKPNPLFLLALQVQLEQLHTGSNSTGGSVSGGNRQEGEPCQNTDTEGMPSGDEAVRVSSNLRPSISSNGQQQSAEGEALREESCQVRCCLLYGEQVQMPLGYEMCVHTS